MNSSARGEVTTPKLPSPVPPKGRGPQFDFGIGQRLLEVAAEVVEVDGPREVGLGEQLAA